MDMDTSFDIQSVVTQQRATLLSDLSNAAQAAQQSVQRTTVGEISDAAYNMQGLNTSLAPPLDPYRGRNLDIMV